MNPSSFMFAFGENLGFVTLIFAIYFKNLIEIRSAYLHSNKLHGSVKAIRLSRMGTR